MIHHTITLLAVSLALVIACNPSEVADPMSHIADQKVKEVLNRGFNSAGGLDTYMNLDEVTFTKKTILYLPDGGIESEVIQQHNYDLYPELRGDITWSDSLGDHGIHYSTADTYKSLNGERLAGSETSARQGFYSNYYVLFLPYKLIDPGVTLSYDGVAEIGDRSAEIIKATYSPEKHDNHSTSDEWYLYFDTTDGRVLANLVYHPPTYAFIENTSTTEEFPLRMNVYRQTWRTDKDRNKEYLRGEFWYSDYGFSSITQN